MTNWVNHKVEDLIDYKKGYAFKSSFYDQEGDHLIVRVSDTTENSINIQTCHKIRKEHVIGLDAYMLRHEDVVIATVGSWADNPQSIVGKVIKVPKEANGAYLNQNAVRLRTNSKITQDYLYFVLKHKEFSDYLLNSAQGSANQASITLKDIFSYQVLLPPLPEQKAIASVLSSLDDKIDLLHRQNKTLEAMAETLFRQWFIEEAKEDWEDCILGDILEVLESGSRPKGGIDPELKSGIPSLGAESINGICKFDYSKVKYVTLEFADSCKKGHAQPWDVLIYKDGAYVGKKALFGEKFPYPRFMINEHVFRLRSNTRCSQLYLYFALDSESLALLNSNSAQPGINQQSLKSYQITLPPKEKMEAFDSVVRPLTIKMNENAIQISTCEKLRDTLLPKLMSGEVRVQYQTEEVA